MQSTFLSGTNERRLSPEEKTRIGMLTSAHLGRGQASSMVKTVSTVIEIESNWKLKAVSSAGARGLMQLMPIAIKEARDFCKIEGPVDMFSRRDNILIGTCYLLSRHISLNKQAEVPSTEVLVWYNGGMRQWIRFKAGKTLTSETRKYIQNFWSKYKTEKGEP